MARKRKELVLIADDDPVHRSLLERILKGEGYDIRVAENGVEAIESFDQQIAVALLDLRMPLKGGMECLSHATEHYPLMPVIVISGAGVGDAVEAMQSGAFSFLQKPISREHLIVTLGRALEYRHHLKRSSDFENLTRGALSRITVAGKSEASKHFWNELKQVSGSQTILCVAEKGINCHEIARHIHQNSPFRAGPFITFSPGAGMPERIEAELFGVTNLSKEANREFPGLLSMAEGGTLFLDGLEDLPARCQPRLEHYLRRRTLKHGGRRESRSLQLQVVCRVSQNLSFLQHQGILQQELCKTIAPKSITAPPLRERKIDIPFLIEEYLEKLRSENENNELSITDQARDILCEYHWPGNTRELIDTLDRAFGVAETGIVGVEHIRFMSGVWRESGILALDPKRKLEEIEKEVISHVVGMFSGNRTRAAESLGVSVKTVYNKLKGF